MDPHYKQLAVALVPQPRQIPPPPFDSADLQWIFSDVIRHYNYQTFEFMFGGRGAQFSNAADDVVEIRPALFQVQAKMDGVDLLTGPMAQEKAMRILKIASERLKTEAFLQCAIQVVATVAAPEPGSDAKKFVAEKLMHDGEQAKVLGGNFFGGGVRFLRHEEDGTGEDSLSVEPFLHDNAQIYVNYQRTRVGAAGPIGGLDQVETWVKEALEFVDGPAMHLLER